MGILRGILKFRNIDSSADLNRRLFGLVPAGVYDGPSQGEAPRYGNAQQRVVPVVGSLQVNVLPFVAMSADSMVVIHENPVQTLDVFDTTEAQYVVLRAKYSPVSDPFLEFEVLTETNYLADPDRTGIYLDQPVNFLITLAKIVLPSTGLTQVPASALYFNENQIINSIGRPSLRGYVPDLATLNAMDAKSIVEGDIYLALAESQFYRWDVPSLTWKKVTDGALQIELTNHKTTDNPAHPASHVSVSPIVGMTAADTQAAIEELNTNIGTLNTYIGTVDGNKVAKAGDTMTGSLSITTGSFVSGLNVTTSAGNALGAIVQSHGTGDGVVSLGSGILVPPVSAGRGLYAQGGNTTNGVGGEFKGGTNNGTGLISTGTGTGSGIESTGGASNGVGLKSTGKGTGVGINSVGGSSTVGASGIISTGGDGIDGTGNTTGGYGLNVTGGNAYSSVVTSTVRAGHGIVTTGGKAWSTAISGDPNVMSGSGIVAFGGNGDGGVTEFPVTHINSGAGIEAKGGYGYVSDEQSGQGYGGDGGIFSGGVGETDGLGDAYGGYGVRATGGYALGNGGGYSTGGSGGYFKGGTGDQGGDGVYGIAGTGNFTTGVGVRGEANGINGVAGKFTANSPATSALEVQGNSQFTGNITWINGGRGQYRLTSDGNLTPSGTGPFLWSLVENNSGGVILNSNNVRITNPGWYIFNVTIVWKFGDAGTNDVEWRMLNGASIVGSMRVKMDFSVTNTVVPVSRSFIVQTTSSNTDLICNVEEGFGNSNVYVVGTSGTGTTQNGCSLTVLRIPS